MMNGDLYLEGYLTIIVFLLFLFDLSLFNIL